MSFNIWTPEGNVVPNSGGVIFSNPNVIYDTTPVVLTGHAQVFKMWCTSFIGNAVYYFESLDGLSWTAYSGNPIVPSATLPRVFKVGNTYYLYSNNGLNPPIEAFTSSDGIHFTLQNASAIASGGAGVWDENVFQICLLDIIGGTWYGYYNGEQGLVSKMGLATSPDGIHWTKNPSNPIISTQGNAISNVSFFKSSGLYYGLFDGAPSNSQLTALGMRNIYVIYSSHVAGPWTQVARSGQIVPAYYAATPADFGSEQSNNAIGDPSILSVNGNLYLYYSVSPSGTATGLNGAIAFATTFDELVGTYEGTLDAPFSDLPVLNLNTLASDNFQRADANPIGGNWTPTTTSSPYGPAQIVSHLVKPASSSSAAAIYWNALGWDADQWSQITIAACAASSDVGVTLRQDTGGAITFYDVLWSGVLGNAGTWFIQKRVAGTITTLASGASPVVNAGDTILGTAIGDIINFYWNGFLLGSASDSSISAGSAGLFVFGNTVPSDAAISAWSGGTFRDGPPFTPTGSEIIANAPTTPLGRAPQMSMRKSTDGGHTFGNEVIRDCGQSGQYRNRVRWLQLGRARDLVIEISGSDPIAWRIIDGYLDVDEGTGV